MNSLPSGWSQVFLGDIAETQLGKMLSKKSKTGVGSRPYLRNKNVQWGRFDLTDVAEMDFTGEEFAKFTLRKGDILVCEGGEVGRAAIWRSELDDCAFQKALHRVRTHEAAMPEFVFYLLRHYGYSNAFERFVTGSTIRHLPQEDLRLLPVPLPPLEEQHRIVAAIEEQFSRLDAADGLLRRVTLNTKALESVGRRSLIEDGGPGWPGVPIRDVCSIEWGNLSITKAQYVESGIPAFSASGPDGFLPFAEHSGPGIVVSAIGARCGRCFWADGEWTAIKNTMVIKVIDPATLHLPFLYQVVDRQDFWPRSGSGQPFIALGKARETIIPLPPLSTQQRIADAAQTLRDRVNATRASARAGAERATVLRAVVLREAFSGRLVA